MKTSPWFGIAWSAPGLLALLIGVVWSWVALRQTRLWLYADHYSDAELEVTRFTGRPRDGERPYSWIEGVVHPGGERVETSDEDIPIRRFISPADPGRDEPLPAEIEGRRIPVSHWPRDAAAQRWWHPPAVVSRGAIPPGGMAASHALVGAAFLGGGLLCFRRGFRILRASVAPDSGVN